MYLITLENGLRINCDQILYMMDHDGGHYIYFDRENCIQVSDSDFRTIITKLYEHTNMVSKLESHLLAIKAQLSSLDHYSTLNSIERNLDKLDSIQSTLSDIKYKQI